ncbi:serine hydrolase [Flammeovirgaceae bacterium SG7u.111]|nr:serine hydrolase [Flammeovirgaceae bacterium SG7u.132]WPO37298.1 serine hydrolase [Flammeovirgaceae bacterium SG7u.111]
MKSSIKIIFLLLLTTCAHGQEAGEAIEGISMQNQNSLPLDLPDQSTSKLNMYRNDSVQKELLTKLKTNEKWRKLIAQKKMAIGVVDLRDPEQIKYAGINDNEMMYAASLPKIAVLLTAMDALEKGEIEETPAIDEDLKLMISRSDNAASTRMIDLLGYDKIASVLRDPQYELYSEKYNGGLWVGKRYAKTGARKPDPILGLSHAATAYQVSRFYYLMVSGRLVSYERSKQMLDIMEDPALHHKFVHTLDQIVPNARIFRKSGSWKNFHSDSVLVWDMSDRHYILVALIEDPEGESIIRQLILPVEEVLHIN